MVSYYNCYQYKTDEELIEHLGVDLIDIMIQIEQDRYVTQEQFKKLDAYLCESYASDIVRILNERMAHIDVFYGFSTPHCFYVFYDTDRITYEEALEKAENFAIEMYGK